jgi:PAS domain-containing protein
VQYEEVIDQLKTAEAQHRQIEDNLTASEVRYRRLFETAQDGILIIDSETEKITDVNPFLSDMLGYDKEHFLGKRLWEIGFFKDIAVSRRAFSELQAKGFIRYEDLPLETRSRVQAFLTIQLLNRSCLLSELYNRLAVSSTLSQKIIIIRRLSCIYSGLSQSYFWFYGFWVW